MSNPEQILLASILFDPNSQPAIFDLPGEVFETNEYRVIYNAAKELYAKGLAVDHERVIAEIDRTEALEQYEPAILIGELAEYVTINTDQIAAQIAAIKSRHAKQQKKTGRIIKVVDVDIEKDFNAYYDSGGGINAGVHPGWANLARLYRPAKGMLNIITGIPSHGKSEFMDALMVTLSGGHGWKWAVFSPENFPYYMHWQKIIEKYIGKPLFGHDRMSQDEFNNGKAWMNDFFYYIEPPEEEINLKSILSMAKELHRKEKIDGIIIDPWNELDREMETYERETDYIGDSLMQCRRFARKNNIYFCIVAHPAKMYKKPEQKNYDIPTLYSISGSGHWYNKADNGIVVYRNFNVDNPELETIDVYVQKIKYKSHGNVGLCSFKYDRVNGRFLEIDKTVNAIQGEMDYGQPAQEREKFFQR